MKDGEEQEVGREAESSSIEGGGGGKPCNGTLTGWLGSCE